MTLISVIIPAFNEAGNLEILTSRLIEVFKEIPYQLEIIVINDGSSDDSQATIEALSSVFNNFFYLNLSRNFGQQSALKAGYDYSRGDAVICMDADLQNPPEMIFLLLKKWEEGYEIVLCKRKNANQGAGYFKKFSSKFFYKALSLLSEVPVERDTPDFRLLDRKLVQIIKQLPEKDIFLRGIISWAGFNRAIVEYCHGPRFRGHTNYSIGKMVALAATGITSFSARPLHIAIYMGLFFSGLSLLFITYAIVRYYQGHTISGWASLIVTVTFLGGLQLFILGIIGLYIGKLLIQAKQRPDYVIRNTNMEFSTEISSFK
ncbi:glycosyltransferase family 2 protein [Pedobacter sp. GR22-6]|uniref:glycosyltransferase family 2 protein n=1 Tax=Pedobacter sp. GR22-6 TaxID=3127957 RepID=UPI00307E93B8